MKITLHVKGMHCASCGMLIQDALEDIGVVQTVVDNDKGTVVVDFDEQKVSLDKIKKTIVVEGYLVE
ncbi:heavy-metal-associated domain-containing protein [Candidatus Woesearchaeota archaeon]|jgi:copper chaperone CopZ|nr:heavy-metal-associated domain-containing protein [Candidatus Woesearchaeota archaeon]MBT5397050.1 heavy-metal-associated domain-containing protein [Candidatus Woesearchaeota archaeon]MBT5924205.1 heavy-metal-associated domain-containing protein [Candidatus Woesearchaeota archaeon]MBT6367404.1 heavy-metal-associated domain-containing protein [Candidatus Woesearchaeota archaeon]MBT7762450.1 heavy-metal-associated domain-containing protein [Candidatus Woesearchaeota archaeon]